jgi:DNA-binding GntR family transcriptional regulator
MASTLASRVRNDVIHGLLRPGTKLRAQELAERYGVSAIPMREALCRLASSGFVRAEDQKGFRVAEVSADELEDITSTRLFIESEALRRSLRYGDLSWEANLIAAHHRMSRTPMQSAGQAGVTPEWEDAHGAFHAALLAACDSQWLLNLADVLRDQTARYRHLSVLPENKEGPRQDPSAARDVTAEHKAILDSALERNADRTIALLTEHFHRTTALVRHKTDHR